MFQSMTFINVILSLVFVYFLGRYVLSLYSEGVNRPEQWAWKIKQKKISKELIQVYRQYGDKDRFFVFWLQVERIKKEQVAGAFAELGVYKGHTARLLHQMEPTRKFHLYDTFDGFRSSDLDKEKGEAAKYTPTNFADTSIDEVKRFLGNSDKFIFHQGHFPETAKDTDNEYFALVNLDADLYKPTRAGLEYFYPRLSPGGVIIVHDYNYKWEGLVRAVDEFVKGIPECPVLLPDTDGSLIIVKNK
jgi:O-methyltransferase